MKTQRLSRPRHVGLGLALLPAWTKPTAHEMNVSDKIALITGKWHYYQNSGSFPATEAGLLRAAKAISADLIKEGNGVSVSDVAEELRNFEWFSLMKERVASALPWYLNPTLLMVTAGLVGGAYLINSYGSLIPRSRR